MNTFTINHATSKASRAYWFNFLRVAVGIVLIWKGINFVLDAAAFHSLTRNNVVLDSITGDALLMVILGSATIVSGLLMMRTRFTRMAALLQLLVFVFGALFIHGGHIERNVFELAFSGIILFLLVMFVARDNYGLPVNRS